MVTILTIALELILQNLLLIVTTTIILQVAEVVLKLPVAPATDLAQRMTSILQEDLILPEDPVLLEDLVLPGDLVLQEDLVVPPLPVVNITTTPLLTVEEILEIIVALSVNLVSQRLPSLPPFSNPLPQVLHPIQIRIHSQVILTVVLLLSPILKIFVKLTGKYKSWPLSKRTFIMYIYSSKEMLS